MKRNNTVLEKVGVSSKIVKSWKIKGIKITYPMQANKSYLKSKDGKVFVESADKYVPPLTIKETKIYKENPEKFRSDFLKNANLFFNFHSFLYEQALLTDKLKSQNEKLACAISLLYLFSSAMDHHYYHFDRYLAYEDYSQTPVGFWWAKLKQYYYKIFNEKVSKTKPTGNFLKLLSRNVEVLDQFKKNLSKTDYKELLRTLEVIKIFEDTQERGAKIISGYPAKEDFVLKTGFCIWNQIYGFIKDNPNAVKKEYYKSIVKIIKSHPVTSTRTLLLQTNLNKFNEEIYLSFKKEINRWMD